MMIDWLMKSQLALLALVENLRELLVGARKRYLKSYEVYFYCQTVCYCISESLYS